MKRLAAVLLLIVCAAPAWAQQNCSANETKVSQWVRNTGLTYRSKGCNMWLVDVVLPAATHPGPDASGLRDKMLIGLDGDTLIMGVVVEVKKSLDTSPATLLNIAQLNNHVDYAKAGIDDDGDLFVRVEARMEHVNEAFFKQAIEDIKAGVEKARQALKSSPSDMPLLK